LKILFTASFLSLKFFLMSNVLYTVGKIIYALTIAFFGIGHLTQADKMQGAIPSALSFMALPLVYITGVCLLLAAVSFIIDRWARIAGILLAVFLILIVLTVHIPHLPDQTAMSMIIKDTAMAGAALMIAGNARS
jgi:putative oxidoreductase